MIIGNEVVARRLPTGSVLTSDDWTISHSKSTNAWLNRALEEAQLYDNLQLIPGTYANLALVERGQGNLDAAATILATAESETSAETSTHHDRRWRCQTQRVRTRDHHHRDREQHRVGSGAVPEKQPRQEGERVQEGVLMVVEQGSRLARSTVDGKMSEEPQAHLPRRTYVHIHAFEP